MHIRPVHGCFHVVCFPYSFSVAFWGKSLWFPKILARFNCTGASWKATTSNPTSCRDCSATTQVAVLCPGNLEKFQPLVSWENDFKWLSIAIRRVFHQSYITSAFYKCFTWNVSIGNFQDRFILDFLNTTPQPLKYWEWRWSRDGEFAGAEVSALSDSNRIENLCWELHNPERIWSVYDLMSAKKAFMYQVKSESP